jgi:hypothetical protein
MTLAYLLRQGPWMPLQGVIEQWATFAQRVTTPELSKAASCAFAALSCEQQALQSYQHAVQGDFCLSLRC